MATATLASLIDSLTVSDRDSKHIVSGDSRGTVAPYLSLRDFIGKFGKDYDTLDETRSSGVAINYNGVTYAVLNKKDNSDTYLRKFEDKFNESELPQPSPATKIDFVPTDVVANYIANYKLVAAANNLARKEYKQAHATPAVANDF